MTYFSTFTKRIGLNISMLVLCFVCLFSLNTNAQTWERFYNFSEFDYFKSTLPTPDGGILFLGHTLSRNTVNGVIISTGDVLMAKTDRDGKLVWQTTYTEGFFEEIFQAIPTSDGNYLLAGLTFNPDGNGNADGWILKIDSDGNLLWDQKYGGPGFDKIYGLHETDDGGYAFVGSTRSEVGGDIIEPEINPDSLDAKDSWIGKVDSDGDLLWNHRFGSYEDDILVNLAIADNGDILAVGNYLEEGIGGDWQISLFRFDQDGNAIWDELYGGDGYEEAFSIIKTSDDNFAIGGMTNSQGAGSSDTYLLRVNQNGEFIDDRTYGGTEGEFAAFVQEMPDGGFTILSSTESLGSDFLDLYLIRTEANGDERWNRVYDGGNEHYDVPYPFTVDENGFYYIVAQQQEKDNNNDILSSQTYILKADAEGNTTTNVLHGKVAIDNNNNCIPETGEQGLEDWLVFARGPNETFYSTTDANGDYFIELELGDYSVEVVAPGDYWEACDEIAFLTIDSPYDTTEYNFNFSDQSIICEEMEVDLSTPYLNYCNENIYNVVYRNNGTVASSGPMVDIILPSSFSLISTTATSFVQNDTLYSFNIEEVPVNEVGSFRITVEHDCSNQISGLTYSLQARISPDEICLPEDPIWDGASIELRAEVVGDNVQFIISNTGSGDMGVVTTGVIIEDWLIPRTEPIQLNSLESDTIIVSPEGQTVRLEIPQTPGHPGRSNPSISVEGVGTNTSGGITTGYINHYAEDDANRFKSIDAQISYQNFLPNVLRAYPRGYESERIIPPNSDIEYHLRFQHTGNDTLPWLFLEDQLPPELNVETLRPGASSHPYDYEVVGDGVVRFNFNNINLVGHESNEAASFGFVKFRVSQHPNLADGTSFFNEITIQKPNSRVNSNGVWHSIQSGNLYGAFFATHCEGDTVFGQVMTEDIVLRDTIHREVRDSITTAKIKVLENVFTEELVAIQSGELYNEVLYTEDTVLVKFYPAYNGCDSIVTTQLDILTNTTPLEDIYEFSLYPNPGFGQVTISYRLPASSGITVRIFQPLGKLIREIDKGIQAAGRHQMTIPPNLPAGIYWVELQTDEGAATKKLVIQE